MFTRYNPYSERDRVRRPHAQPVSECGESVEDGGFEFKFFQSLYLFLQVGIEDSLHIEFEYNKARYHVEEAIIGI